MNPFVQKVSLSEDRRAGKRRAALGERVHSKQKEFVLRVISENDLKLRESVLIRLPLADNWSAIVGQVAEALIFRGPFCLYTSMLVLIQLSAVSKSVTVL